MKRALPFLIIVVVLVVAVAVAWSLKETAVERPALSPTPNPATPSTTPAHEAAQQGAVPPHSHGLDTAPVTLEEFGDFQCPPCGFLHPILKQMETEFGDNLRVVFREYPLVPAHAHALSAARAAEAAGLQGKFWEMHAMLFENQTAWKDAFDVRPIFEGYATKIGLDLKGSGAM